LDWGRHDDRRHRGPEIPSPHGEPALPRPRLTLSEINGDYGKYLAELEQGGAILVYSDDRQALLGVLTRDPAMFGDARLAQQIEAGNLPPLEQLLEHAVDEPGA
jgi:hypothetical protein